MNEKKLDEERKYLEGLFNSRFNFYLLFISLFLNAVLNDKSGLSPITRVISLFSGTGVSFLMSLAIFRTHFLVETILKTMESELPDRLAETSLKTEEKKFPRHPYPIIAKDSWGPKVHANWFISIVPPLITLFLLFLSIWSLLKLKGIVE